VVFKIFASFGLCEKMLLKSKISNFLSLISSLIYLLGNPHSWNIIKSSVNGAYMERLYYRRHNKSGNPSSPKKIAMEGLHNHQFKLR
jgi:hypothetical protein